MRNSYKIIVFFSYVVCFVGTNEFDDPNSASNIINSSVIVGKTIIPTCWGPSSPTAGTTAESIQADSPEEATRGSTILYNGKFLNQFLLCPNFKCIKYRKIKAKPKNEQNGN